MIDDRSGSDRRVTVVINRSAGDGDVASARAAFEALRASGRVAIRETDGAGVAGAVRTARSLGVREVVVVGGDGSVQRSAREVAGNGTVLVPAPGGTLNHFARRYGIETLAAAASLVGRGRVAAVPLGVADDLLFLNTIVLGAYPFVLRIRERLEGVVGKWPAAGVGFGAALARMPRVRLEIETETRRLERRTAMVWIGLGRGGWPLSHHIDRDVPEPVLEVVVLRDIGRLAATRWLARLGRDAMAPGSARDPAEDPAIEILHARSLVVRRTEGDAGARVDGARGDRDSGAGAAPAPLDATLDGDPVTLAAPLFVSAVGDALRIRVPS